MTFKPSNIFVGTLILVMTACTVGEVASPVVPGKENYIKTSKPGAGVFISADYDGTAKAGEERILRVKVRDQYPSGTLKVSVLPNPELSLSGVQDVYVFDMSGDRAHEIRLSVKALSNGIHYLNFQAVAEYGDRQVARANSAITFNVGVSRSKVVKPSPGKARLEKQAASEVVVMEAEEEIIVNK